MKKLVIFTLMLIAFCSVAPTVASATELPQELKLSADSTMKKYSVTVKGDFSKYKNKEKKQYFEGEVRVDGLNRRLNGVHKATLKLKQKSDGWRLRLFIDVKYSHELYVEIRGLELDDVLSGELQGELELWQMTSFPRGPDPGDIIADYWLIDRGPITLQLN